MKQNLSKIALNYVSSFGLVLAMF